MIIHSNMETDLKGLYVAVDALFLNVHFAFNMIIRLKEGKIRVEWGFKPEIWAFK